MVSFVVEIHQYIFEINIFSLAQMTAKDPEPKSMIQKQLEELASVHLLETSDSAYSVEFRGSFECQSFASIGIILLNSKIYKVCISALFNSILGQSE
jgi:hypothetical protein